MESNKLQLLALGAGATVLVGTAIYFLNRKTEHKEEPSGPRVHVTPLRKRAKTLNSVYLELKDLFDLPLSKLVTIRENFLREITEGLESDSSVSKSSLAMIPTFVSKLPVGTEKGTTYALDIGGTNIRVLKCSLDGNGKVVIEQASQRTIMPELQRGSGEDLFDFIAKCVSEVITNKDNIDLGFTFSFPVAQLAIDSGMLIRWTKGFTSPNVEGKDICKMLNDSFKKIGGVEIKVNALINDTVGTLLCGSYQEVNVDCCVGVILGTGSNACYYERVDKIKKMPADVASKFGDHMVINMECGNFGSRPDTNDLISTNEYDTKLDVESLNPGKQFLEKQISGMYLGEIVRLILRKQVEAKILFKDNADALKERNEFSTSDMSSIEEDESADLSGVDKVLQKFNISATSEEKQFVKNVVHIVAERAARLSALTIAALMKQLGKENKDVVVAVDGSVFEKYPGFKKMMDDTLLEMLGHSKVTLKLAKDGSGVGAALASFMVSNSNAASGAAKTSA
eukprot:TRINITY_DN2118_c1_g1_i2.p1 TRINITY_DN2118_c1_g1~~TRINITY_DN2118_c1_g1_i2.p1  ORF type:complete len:511 (+),score=165.44 TRINITY_DN2118_c1_g1_i2:2619-4151(+)